MADPVPIVVTQAGLDALVNAQAGDTEKIRITEIGLTQQVFVPAPTLTALPGEFKRLETLSGQSVSETIIHMSAQDSGQETYDLRGFGLFLEDGTLFGVFGQASPLVRKTSVAAFLFSVDVAFAGNFAASIEFGDATFLYPPATETIRGVARVATQALVTAGVDDQSFITALKLAVRLAPVLQSIATETATRINAVNSLLAALDAEAAARLQGDQNLVNAITAEQAARLLGDQNLTNAITAEQAARLLGDQTVTNALNALLARTIGGTGLITGGGDLTAPRTLDVAAASAAELQAAALATKAATPASFGGLPRVRGTVGYEVFPGGTLVQRGLNRVATPNTQVVVSLTFPIAFADTDYDLQLTTVIPGPSDHDNFFQEIDGTRTPTGVQIFSQDPSGGGSSVVAGFNWRAEGVV